LGLFARCLWPNAGLRLDHFLLNKKIAPRLKAAAVDKDVRGWKGASDHAPVWIELADNDLPKEKTSATENSLEKQIAKAETGTGTSQQPTADLKILLKDAPKLKVPSNIKPMKATLVDAPFDDPGWVYEIKWDGYRAVAIVNNG
jgi:bifunctional non-homologous end joining protein LigD